MGWSGLNPSIAVLSVMELSCPVLFSLIPLSGFNRTDSFLRKIDRLAQCDLAHKAAPLGLEIKFTITLLIHVKTC